VTQRDAPYPPGATFSITYLPEDPSLSRPGVYSLERFNAEVDLTFQRRLFCTPRLSFVARASS
jgi:hypothetical protein